jgi:hypothetical protein
MQASSAPIYPTLHTRTLRIKGLINVLALTYSIFEHETIGQALSTDSWIIILTTRTSKRTAFSTKDTIPFIVDLSPLALAYIVVGESCPLIYAFEACLRKMMIIFTNSTSFDITVRTKSICIKIFNLTNTLA